MLETWEEFDLELSLYASFSLPLFEEHGEGGFTKIYGYKAGLRLRGYVGTLEYEGCDTLEASLLSGCWFDPLEEARKLPRRRRACFYELWQVFPGLGIAIDPWDPKALFYSIFLSRNTDYHVNTVRWVREMALRAGGEEGISSLDPRSVGSSYQLAQLAEVREEALGVLDRLPRGLDILGSEGFYRSVKKDLLALPYVGPKTVHAFGLFCFGLTQLAPADRHLLRVARSLGLVDEEVRLPRKELCMIYDCSRGPSVCPQARRCLTAIMMEELGPLAGWFQTASFLYGCLYLSKGQDPMGLLRR